MNNKTKPSDDNESKTSKQALILQSASDLFLDNGFETTSMDQIALHAGVSKQTVYSHFGSKEALFTAVIEGKCRQYEITEDLFDLDLPIHDALVNLAKHFSDLILSDDAVRLHRVAIAGGEKHSKIAQLYWQAGPVWMQTHFAQYLEHKKAAGQVSVTNPLFAAQQFLFMIKGETHMRLLLNIETELVSEQLNDYLDDCVRFFEKAYVN